MSAESCPVCLAPLFPEERFCSKTCRQRARAYKQSCMQQVTLLVTNEVHRTLTRKARESNTTVEALLIDAIQRGWT
jgi:predicted nucleic acid-binding Zn ribbon protein